MGEVIIASFETINGNFLLSRIPDAGCPNPLGFRLVRLVKVLFCVFSVVHLILTPSLFSSPCMYLYQSIDCLSLFLCLRLCLPLSLFLHLATYHSFFNIFIFISFPLLFSLCLLHFFSVCLFLSRRINYLLNFFNYLSLCNR